MSSSNIIKADKLVNVSINEYQFGLLQDHQAQSVSFLESDGFVQLIGKTGSLSSSSTRFSSVACEDGNATQDEGPEMIEEISIGISEEELFLKTQESYDRGFEEGQRQAERGLANVFKALREGVAGIVALRSQILRESEEDLLKLSILVAGKIVQQEIAQDRAILAKVVTAALDGTTESDDIVIRLNPEDFKLVTSQKNNYLIGAGKDRPINFKADETISFGGCIIDTMMGEIDARTETQLEEIYKKLQEERSGLIGISHTILSDKDHYAYNES